MSLYHFKRETPLGAPCAHDAVILSKYQPALLALHQTLCWSTKGKISTLEQENDISSHQLKNSSLMW